MTEKQAHIDATFGGKQVRFRIRRDQQNIGMIFNMTLGAPYALFQKFALGNWTIADLKSVLSIAYDDGQPKSLFTSPAEVDAVLNRNPPGIYVPLAVGILESYLFGIDPERGVFDERPKEEAAA